MRSDQTMLSIDLAFNSPIKHVNKGGLNADLEEIQGFISKSHVSLKSEYKNQPKSKL